MRTLWRGARDVLRNPIRLVLVVVLLGTSLTFVAAMVAINGSIASRVASVRNQVGNAITIRPAGVFGGGFGFGGGGGFGSQGGSAAGGGQASGQPAQVQVPVVTTAEMQTVAHTPDVTRVTGQVTERYAGQDLKGSISFTGFNGTFSPPPLITGITPGAGGQTLLGGGSISIVQGRNLRATDAGKDVAVMGQALASVNHLGVGSTFPLEGASVKVVGLYTTGQRFGDNSLAMPITTVQHLYKLNGVSTVTAYTASSTDVSAVTSNLQKSLGSKVDIVTAGGNGGIYSALQTTQANVKSALVASLLAAALVVIFAVFIVLRERAREIGVLKALGASNLTVVAQFSAEIFTMSAIAAVLAIILLAVAGPGIAHQFSITPPAFPAGAGRGFGFGGGGFGGGFGGFRRAFGGLGLGSTTQLTAGLTLQTLLDVVVLGIVLSVIASIIPAWYVSHIRPATVLRQTAA